ncbi:uncharacterized protein LOC131940039 isoform X2 [Physella acuta]|nr:uncharacterized protein LOC131940039 isoform X2 [Physella acuta]
MARRVQHIDDTIHNCGSLLFLHFVRQRLNEDAPVLIDSLLTLRQIELTVDPDVIDLSNALNEVAKEYQASDQRLLTKAEANKPNLELSENDFIEIVRMMMGSFDSQYKIETIVVIFFYFYDFMLRMSCKGTPRMDEILQWCQQAFTYHLDPKVDAVGGWKTILETSKPGLFSSFSQWFTFRTKRKY